MCDKLSTPDYTSKLMDRPYKRIVCKKSSIFPLSNKDTATIRFQYEFSKN